MYYITKKKKKIDIVESSTKCKFFIVKRQEKIKSASEIRTRKQRRWYHVPVAVKIPKYLTSPEYKILIEHFSKLLKKVEIKSEF